MVFNVIENVLFCALEMKFFDQQDLKDEAQDKEGAGRSKERRAVVMRRHAEVMFLVQPALITTVIRLGCCCHPAESANNKWQTRKNFSVSYIPNLGLQL